MGLKQEALRASLILAQLEIAAKRVKADGLQIQTSRPWSLLRKNCFPSGVFPRNFLSVETPFRPRTRLPQACTSVESNGVKNRIVKSGHQYDRQNPSKSSAAPGIRSSSARHVFGLDRRNGFFTPLSGEFFVRQLPSTEAMAGYADK